jgi:hypothetical protein
MDKSFGSRPDEAVLLLPDASQLALYTKKSAFKLIDAEESLTPRKSWRFWKRD